MTMDVHHNFRILDAAFIVGAVITFLADQATGWCAGWNIIGTAKY